MPKSPAPLLQRTLDPIVLQLLRSDPTTGSALSLRIQAISGAVREVTAGSLYPPRCRLEERDLIRAEWEETPSGRRSKVYSWTPSGRRHLAEQPATCEQFSGALAAILKTT